MYGKQNEPTESGEMAAPVQQGNPTGMATGTAAQHNSASQNNSVGLAAADAADAAGPDGPDCPAVLVVPALQHNRLVPPAADAAPPGHDALLATPGPPFLSL